MFGYEHTVRVYGIQEADGAECTIWNICGKLSGRCGMDRRQQKTRKAIFRAFTDLLEHNSYGSLTVQEIIDEADVGRSTFYAHFETKDELLRALCTEIFDHVFSEEMMKERTHDFSSGEQGMGQKVTHILYHLRDSRAAIRGILSSEGGELFMRYFKEYLSKVFAGALGDRAFSVPRDYLLNHMVCDFTESVRWWMTHEEYTPEEIAGFYLTTTPELG